jgi:hypothetical protein
MRLSSPLRAQPSIDKAHAVEVARKTQGVDSVVDNLTVRKSRQAENEARTGSRLVHSRGRETLSLTARRRSARKSAAP